MKYKIRNWLGALALASASGTASPALADTIPVSGGITSATSWYHTNEYVLNGFCYVLDGAVLTIEPGTVIKGMPGTGTNTSCLIVTAGAKLRAEGTRTRPIIFTAEADDVTDPEDIPIYQRGLWGGVVIMGKAVINTPSDAAGAAANPKYDVFEGMPDNQIDGQYVNRFGGTDDDDSSGVLRYVSIRHAGVVFLPNKELNALSLCCVGRGTTIDHVEMYAAADDGVEFFGGTVNTKYLVSAFNDDDCFDIDQGYRGKNQFWFAIQDPAVKDNGGEWNGEPNALTSATPTAPYANYEIYNATWIGAGTNISGNRGLQIREYAAPKVYNSILTDFGGSAVRVDAKSYYFLTNGLLDLRDNLWWNFATNGVAVALTDASSVAGTEVLFTDAARHNVLADPLLTGISRTNDGGLDPRPRAGSPALTITRPTPSDGFYSSADYKGAFGAVNWATDWTALSAYGILTAAGGGHPADRLATAPPSAPRLTLQLAGTDLLMTYPGVSGRTYQLQSASTVTGTWNDVGLPVSGTDATVTNSQPIVGTEQYYRVQAR